MFIRKYTTSSLIMALALGLTATAQQSQAQEDLSKQLSNPISSLISVPFKLNYDEGLGPNGNGERTILNIQPVIPFSISTNWNLISRTIIPLIDQTDVIPGTSQEGLGDITQSFFFSPKKPTAGGLIWGVGPIFLLPTGETGLGAGEFAAGINGVALKQVGSFTYGVLANHLWSDGVADNGNKINATFFQPFVSYTDQNKWTYSLNTESTYDWEAEDGAIPINLQATKLLRVGSQNLSVGGGVRYWAESTETGPDGWGATLLVTLLFPK